MHPIAFIAFLMGINGTSAPGPCPAQNKIKDVQTAQPTPQKPPTTPKRGGWDRN